MAEWWRMYVSIRLATSNLYDPKLGFTDDLLMVY